MFLSTLKKTLESEKIIHRFIYENTNFFEDMGKIDQKKYNDLQIDVLKKIAEIKFGGDVNKFVRDPTGLKAMQTYREYVKEKLPFLLASNNNPNFNPKSDENVDSAVKFILNKLYPQMALRANG